MVDPDRAKLFVGGISRETSEEGLTGHFSKYGCVLHSHVAKDRPDGTRRGFGFVTFSDPSSADEALQDKHVIDRKRVDVKRALPRSEANSEISDGNQNKGSSRNGDRGSRDNRFRTKKIFVGGLASSVNREEFRNYFEEFGSISDVVVMHDSVTNKPRGFGFITFDSEDSVESVLQKSCHELNGKPVEVKRAVPKDCSNSNGHFSGIGGGDGGRSPYNAHQYGGFAPFGYSYGYYSYYPPLVGYNCGGGYFPGSAYGSYYGISYPMAAFGPGSPYGFSGYSLPYANSGLHPAYSDNANGVMGTTVGGQFPGGLRPKMMFNHITTSDNESKTSAEVLKH